MMKKLISSAIVCALTINALPIYKASAENAVYKDNNQNSSMNQAQQIPLSISLINQEVSYSVIEGDLVEGKDDWYSFDLKEIGSFLIEFRDSQGRYIHNGSVPTTTVYATRYDGSFGHVSESLGMEGYDNGFVNHKSNNKVYVKVNSQHWSDFKNGKYYMYAYFLGNPKTSNHEPNNVFDHTYKYYEFATIPENSLISTSWENGRYDVTDNFGIETSKNKGTLKYEIHYPDNEYNHWKSNNIDSYKSYSVYAERADGSMESIGGKATIGMPSQIFSQEIKVDNKNYTGRYIVSLNNGTRKDSNYKIKMMFEADNSAPVANFNFTNEEIFTNKTAINFINKSTDADNDTLKYQWLLKAPNSETFKPASTTKDFVSFTPTVNGTWNIKLIATDDKGLSSEKILSFNSKEINHAPIANFVSSFPTDIFAKKTKLTFKNTSQDANNDTLSYQWSVKKPNDATFIKVSQNKDLVDFVPDASGKWTVKLTAFDGEWSSQAKTLDFDVKDVPVNSAPISSFELTPNGEIVADRTTLNFKNKSSDKENDSLVYQWSIKKPSGKSYEAVSQNKDVTYKPIEVGTYQVKLIVTDSKGLSSEKVVNFNASKRVLGFERLAGDTRYQTSTAITNKIKDHSLDYVIVTSGENFPDALSGGVLNGTFNATTLLVKDNEKIIETKMKEAKRILKPTGKVIILGGEVAVSKSIESKFKNQFKVERISGKKRVETAIKVAEKINAKPKEVFLVNGNSFADSLSIVPQATREKKPILLNMSVNKLDESVKQYIKEVQLKKVTIIGSSSVISNEIQKELNSMGVSVERIGGINRFETSLLIAKKYYPEQRSVAITNGWDFPDSLSGSRLAHDLQMPIILVDKKTLKNNTKEYLNGIDKVFILGGDAVVENDILKGI